MRGVEPLVRQVGIVDAIVGVLSLQSGGEDAAVFQSYDLGCPLACGYRLAFVGELPLVELQLDKALRHERHVARHVEEGLHQVVVLHEFLHIAVGLFPLGEGILQGFHLVAVLWLAFGLLTDGMQRSVIGSSVLLLRLTFCCLPCLEVGYLSAEQGASRCVGDVFLGDVAAYVLGVVVLGRGSVAYEYLLDEVDAGCGEGRHT